MGLKVVHETGKTRRILVANGLLMRRCGRFSSMTRRIDAAGMLGKTFGSRGITRSVVVGTVAPH